MSKFVGRSGVRRAQVFGERRGKGIKPVGIGADLFQRRDFTDIFPGEIAAACAVAGSAIFLVNRCAVLRFDRIDGERFFKGRRRGAGIPYLDTRHGGVVHTGRSGSSAEGGVEIAFFYVIVVAIPMQLHSGFLALIPDSWKVCSAQQLLMRQLFNGEIEQGLGGIEGIDPARSPIRLCVNEAHSMHKGGDAVAHQRDGNRVNHIAIQQRKLDALFLDSLGSNDWYQIFGTEFHVMYTAIDEFLEGHQIKSVGAHANHQHRLGIRFHTYGGGMAHCAIEKSAVDAQVPALTHADRKIVARLKNHAQ